MQLLTNCYLCFFKSGCICTVGFFFCTHYFTLPFQHLSPSACPHLKTFTFLLLSLNPDVSAQHTHTQREREEERETSGQTQTVLFWFELSGRSTKQDQVLLLCLLSASTHTLTECLNIFLYDHFLTNVDRLQAYFASKFLVSELLSSWLTAK